MAAAVADFRPAVYVAAARSRSGDGEEPDAVELVRNPDILAELSARPARGRGQVVVGFAAETGDDATTC